MAMHLLTPLTPQERSDTLAGFSVAPGSRANATHVRTEHGCTPIYYYNRHGTNDWYIWDTSKPLWVRLSTPPDIEFLTTREECEEYVLLDQNQAPSRYDVNDPTTWLTEPAWHLALEDAEYFTPETATNHARYFKRDSLGQWFTTPDIRYPVQVIESLERTFGFKFMEWTRCDKDPSSLPMVQKPNTTSPENDLDNW